MITEVYIYAVLTAVNASVASADCNQQMLYIAYTKLKSNISLKSTVFTFIGLYVHQ